MRNFPLILQYFVSKGILSRVDGIHENTYSYTAMPFNPTSHRRKNKLKVEGAINIIVNEFFFFTMLTFCSNRAHFCTHQGCLDSQARLLAVASCSVRRTVAITITNFFVLHDSFGVSINGVGHLQLY